MRKDLLDLRAGEGKGNCHVGTSVGTWRTLSLPRS
jgi:hypothetical protein